MTSAEDDVSARLAAIEHHLRRITRELEEMDSRLAVVTGNDGDSTP